MNPRFILTPEHVQIRLQPAGLGSRFIAFVLDWLAAAALSGALATLLLSMLPAGLGYFVWATLSFLIGWGYHVYFETRHEGRSPGKRALRLRVVDGRGLPLSMPQSFVRNVVRALDMAPLMYGVGALSCLLDRHRRRLGDLVADTVVVAEGRTFEPDPMMVLSPEYNSLRTPRVLRMARRRLSLDDREFLATLVRRAPEMEDGARFDLMEEAGAFYRQRLELQDLPLGGEQVVRGLVAVLFAESAGRRRGGRPAGRIPRAS